MQNPILKITTLSGEEVQAPIYVWLQELILMLPPDDMVALMRRVEQAKAPKIVTPGFGTIPADPAAYLKPDGTPRKQLPRRY